MSAKPIETLRGADRMVEAIARDLSVTVPLVVAESSPYSLPAAIARGLAEPGAMGFSSVAAVSSRLDGSNPAMMLANADHNGLPQADVMEALLYIVGDRIDCRQKAEQALDAFGSVGAVLAASTHDLIGRLGVHDHVAYTLKAIHAGMCSVLREPIRERVLIGSIIELIDYLGLSLKHAAVEVLRMLYLDRKNGLISDEEVSRGTVDHAPLYPREIVKRALEHGASAVIMVHNHPSGDPKPSSADVKFSQELQRALNVMGIVLHDSLIVGRNGHASLRSLGHL